MPRGGSIQHAFGRRRLTDRQLVVLSIYYRLKKPTMNEVARELGISKNGVMSHIYPLVVAGYLEQLAIGKWRSIRLTAEKGVPYCKQRERRQNRTKRKRQAMATEERDAWIYRMRMQRTPCWKVVELLDKTPAKWPRVVSVDAISQIGRQYAAEHGLPAPQRCHVKKLVRRK